MKNNVFLSISIIIFYASLLLISTALPVQAEFEHCVAVYQAATRNLQIDELSYSSLNTIYDDFCESSGEIKKSASSAGIEATIEKIPIKFSGTTGSSSAKMKQFCRSYSNVRDTREASRAFKNTVVVDALKSFNECIEISKRGIVVEHSLTTGIDTAFSFRFGSNLTYQLQGVQTGRNITCTIQKPDNKDLVKLDKKSAFKYTSNFSAFCNREAEPQGAEGRYYYPRTSVIFASNHGNYSVIYPAEEIEDAEFASMLDKRISNLEARTADLNKTVNNNNTAITTALANKSQELKTELNNLYKRQNNFSNNLSVKVYKVMVGQHGANAGQSWIPIGCNDVNGWAKAKCGNAAAYVQLIGDRKGDSCGYTFFTVTCVNKSF